MLATADTAPASGPAIRNAKDLEARLAEVERSLVASEAYDSAENLIGAYGYYLDESPSELASLFMQRGPDTTSGGPVFVNQILQPVIDVAPDGKSAKIRARLLDLAGTSGGAGNWTAGALEGQIILQQGKWRFETAHSTTRWSAPYPGGWAKVP